MNKKNFPSPKKILFINNKGGVGKSSISFNVACKFSEMGYKTCIVDLDPQCNLTMYAVGNLKQKDNYELFNEDYKNQNSKSIYEIISPQLEGESDILEEKPKEIKPNLFLIQGDLSMSLYEDSATNAFGQATNGQTLGFRIITAVDRYINYIGREMEIDVFIIDTSPSLGMMNRLFLLGTDYFVVPVLSDAFSFQGIENLGKTLTKWKDNWKTIKQIAKTNNINSKFLLDGDPKFLGYISNKWKPYDKKQTKAQEYWAKKIEESIEPSLSKHSINGDNQNPKLAQLRDYGTIIGKSQESNKAIFQLEKKDTTQINLDGTKQLFEKSNEEFKNLAESIIDKISNKY